MQVLGALGATSAGQSYYYPIFMFFYAFED